jgi:hypothetical protein
MNRFDASTSATSSTKGTSSADANPIQRMIKLLD